MNKWLINGSEAGVIAPDDRGLAYGDGLFETIAVRAGECRFLEAHLQRLAAGCERLMIPYPGDECLRADIIQLGACVHGTLKIIVTRGSGPRGYALPPSASVSVTRLVGLMPTDSPSGAAGTVRVRYCNTLLGRNPSLAGIKTLNRLEQVIARAEWDDPAIREALMLTDQGEVVCGTMTNLFLVRNGQLVTPDLSECGVHGVMRDQVFRLAEEIDIQVNQTRLSKADVSTADDLFLTNSQLGMLPVDELEGQLYKRSEITLRLMRGLAAAGVEECQC
jgi:4-amino-4-deoxychorismate lyase